MAVTINLNPHTIVKDVWKITITSTSPLTTTYNDCMLTNLGEFVVGSQSDTDESFSMPPSVNIKFQIRPFTALNAVFNSITAYDTEVLIERKVGAAYQTYFKGRIDSESVELDHWKYIVSFNVVFGSYKTKSVDAKTNPLTFNISAVAPQTNNYFVWYYYDKLFDYQNLSTHYNTLIVDENIIGRYDDGDGGFYYSTINGYDNGGFTSYLTTTNPYWFTTGYANRAPAQLGDSLKTLTKHFGLIFTVGLENKYYLLSRWKVEGKTPVSLKNIDVIESYARSMQGKEGLLLRKYNWNGSTWLLNASTTYGNVTYNADGSIANSTGVETIDLYNIFAGGNYVGGYPGDIRYNANYILEQFSVDGGITFDDNRIIGESIWNNVGYRRRNTVVTINGIDWNFEDYYTFERDNDLYTYRCRQMKIDVEKNQTELDLVQVF